MGYIENMFVLGFGYTLMEKGASCTVHSNYNVVDITFTAQSHIPCGHLNFPLAIIIGGTALDTDLGIFQQQPFRSS